MRLCVVSTTAFKHCEMGPRVTRDCLHQERDTLFLWDERRQQLHTAAHCMRARAYERSPWTLSWILLRVEHEVSHADRLPMRWRVRFVYFM